MYHGRLGPRSNRDSGFPHGSLRGLINIFGRVQSSNLVGPILRAVLPRMIITQLLRRRIINRQRRSQPLLLRGRQRRLVRVGGGGGEPEVHELSGNHLPSAETTV